MHRSGLALVGAQTTIEATGTVTRGFAGSVWRGLGPVPTRSAAAACRPPRSADLLAGQRAAPEASLVSSCFENCRAGRRPSLYQLGHSRTKRDSRVLHRPGLGIRRSCVRAIASEPCRLSPSRRGSAVDKIGEWVIRKRGYMSTTPRSTWNYRLAFLKSLPVNWRAWEEYPRWRWNLIGNIYLLCIPKMVNSLSSMITGLLGFSTVMREHFVPGNRNADPAPFYQADRPLRSNHLRVSSSDP